MLQLADRLRIQQVIFPVDAVVVRAADRQLSLRTRGRLEGILVAHLRFPGDHAQAHALDSRNRPGKVLVHQLLVEADGFEYLRAAIALQRRNAHLRKGLEQPLVNALDEVAQPPSPQ